MDTIVLDNNNNINNNINYSSDGINNKIPKCLTHNKQFKFICYKCNELLCSKCNNLHIQLKGTGHNCQHIDDISSNLSSHFKEGGSGDGVVATTSDNIKKRVDSLWQNINHSSNSLSNLEEKENEIAKYYEELHEYLRIKECYLKKPIVAEKESVFKHIKDSLVELQSESIDYSHSSEYTFNSVVSVGENVYVFGGGKDTVNQSKYFRYSTKKRSMVVGDFKSDINGVACGRSISVCYDGKNHVYLINGHEFSTDKYHQRIDRFNLANMSFEKFFDFPESEENHNHIFSFFYKDILYTISDQIYTFQAESRLLSHLSIRDIKDICTACTDGVGNLFILMKNPYNVRGFCRLNIDTNRIEKLQLPNDIRFGDSMLYHEGVIYLIGGKDRKNYTYSVEKKEWSRFFKNDTSKRRLCGSAIVNIN
ncbi:hypothetical protein PPL_09780 [Heterostelium album PN500]|uniref:B box-type domain-containing protein n=1 Tax=Heterostelium pallidum (strain ATCC 26659 / Pp 5 / PN500) TaxID=670386 RepID=D3BP18_HETP5|nr:hypothetical protein PPL_09780 [Heterostelium album PN500]EFA77028.1 hypothetical protein PPL_09780 [Heterostelium album PN500]|eukprot:XP_020429158.1 hypothetical protein PPL_09780 [Heterostelium album PN500]